MLLQLVLELLARFDKLALSGVELFLNQLQLVLQLHLVHGQRLNLPLQDVHALGGHHRADIRHDGIGKDLVDQTMIARKSCVRNVLERIAIVLIFLVLRRLDVDTTILLATTTLRARPRILVPITVSTRFLLVLRSQISQIRRRCVIRLQILLVLELFRLVLRDELLLKKKLDIR